MKQCNICLKILNLNDFHKDKIKKDGHQNRCKTCDKNLKIERRKKLNYPINVLEKKCITCNLIKKSKEFHKDSKQESGLRDRCKTCVKIWTKKYYSNNIDIIKEKTKIYKKENKQKVNEYVRNRQKERLSNDSYFKLKRCLRNRLYYALKNTQWKKNSKFTKYIGCDRDILIKHLESQFQLGMTWNNHGEWHIDHKIALSTAQSEQELYQLCHYSNLQPLWATDNIRKGNK